MGEPVGPRPADAACLNPKPGCKDQPHIRISKTYKKLPTSHPLPPIEARRKRVLGELAACNWQQAQPGPSAPLRELSFFCRVSAAKHIAFVGLLLAPARAARPKQKSLQLPGKVCPSCPPGRIAHHRTHREKGKVQIGRRSARKRFFLPVRNVWGANTGGGGGRKCPKNYFFPAGSGQKSFCAARRLGAMATPHQYFLLLSRKKKIGLLQ